MKKLFPVLMTVLLLCSCGKEDLSIMSFNIRYNGAWVDDGENAWTNRRDAVAAMILQAVTAPTPSTPLIWSILALPKALRL